jgi:hypothetical protein
MSASSGANDSRRLVWHPEVHKHFGEQLYYVAVTSYNLYAGARSTLSEIERILGRSCAAYVVYGSQDLWLRFWARNAQANALSEYLKLRLVPPDTANVFVADPIMQLWGHRVDDFTASARSALDIVSQARLSGIQQTWPEGNDAQALTTSGAILGSLELQPYSSKSHIRLFLLIENFSGIVSEAAMTSVIFEKASASHPASLVSLAHLRGTSIYVVELAAPDYWSVDEICDPIRDGLKLVIRNTTTQLVSTIFGDETDYCDFSSLGLEVLESMLFRLDPDFLSQQVEQRLTILKIFQKWHNYWYNPTLRDFGERFISGLIHAQPQVLEQAIASITPHVETKLRDTVRRLFTETYGTADFARAVAFRKSVDGKGWDGLAMGDSVELLHSLGEKAGSEEASRLSEAMRPFVPLRNRLHGGKTGSDWLQLEQLADVVDSCISTLAALLDGTVASE